MCQELISNNNLVLYFCAGLLLNLSIKFLSGLNQEINIYVDINFRLYRRPELIINIYEVLKLFPVQIDTFCSDAQIMW